MICSLILSCFNRPHLLRLCLESIKKQSLNHDLEIVLVNDGKQDDGTENVYKEFLSIFNIKYVFSGFRNKEDLIPRNPAFPNNIGVKNSSGDLIILSCPEMYHVNSALNFIIEPVLKYKRILSIPDRIYFDHTGGVLARLNNRQEIVLSLAQADSSLNKYPFFMCLRKEDFVRLGGYDEDFTGYAAEDDDLVNRFLNDGFTFYETKSKVVHLYHGPRCAGGIMADNPLWLHNYNLFQSRLGTIVRNIGREWGVNQ